MELDRIVLLQKGSFVIVRYWLSGWVGVANKNASVKFIDGFTGKETEVTETQHKNMGWLYWFLIGDEK